MDSCNKEIKAAKGKGKEKKGNEQHTDKCVFVEENKPLFGSLQVGRNAMSYWEGKQKNLLEEKCQRAYKLFKCISKLFLSKLPLTPHHVLVVVSSHNHPQKNCSIQPDCTLLQLEPISNFSTIYV